MTDRNNFRNTTDSPVTKYFLRYANENDVRNNQPWQIWGLEDERNVNNAFYDSREDAFRDASMLRETLGEGYDLGDEATEDNRWCDRAYHIDFDGKQTDGMMYVRVGEVTIQTGQEIEMQDL